jgi:two-component system phosphate regulon sensor histidine kinase PhoR
VESIISRGATADTETEITLEDGDPVILRRMMVPCPTAAGRPAAWVIMWQDVTGLAAAAAARERGLMVVSHEMRSPLASLGLIVEVLSGVSGELNDEQRTRMLRYLGHETDRLARLVAGVMDLSRFDSPDFRLSPAPLQLGPLVDRVAAMFVPRCEQHGGQFVCAVPADLPTISADEDRLEQVLVNLCDNAVSYTPDGGTVTLTVEPLPEAIRFSVSDTGPGIAPEFHGHIFEKFDRGALTAGGRQQGQAGGGLGLGLALTKRIVELHHGTIRVASELGHGATFVVELPLAPARA